MLQPGSRDQRSFNQGGLTASAVPDKVGRTPLDPSKNSTFSMIQTVLVRASHCLVAPPPSFNRITLNHHPARFGFTWAVPPGWGVGRAGAAVPRAAAARRAGRSRRRLLVRGSESDDCRVAAGKGLRDARRGVRGACQQIVRSGHLLNELFSDRVE